MLRAFYLKYLTGKQKQVVKSKYNQFKKIVVNALFSYDGAALQAKLRQMGIAKTDTLLVHANFEPDSGFKGSPGDIVNALMEYVGREGNLMMVSIPFRGSAFDHLMKNKTFYIQKTVSMMGLVTETFRRKEGVLRSFHPTHPVLVYGKDAAWLADGHDRCLYPCGPDSPFDKFRRLKGKILFFDVGFGAITFFHYVEDLIKDKLPFDVYHPEPFSAPAYDEKNQLHQIKTYAFNKNVVRRADKLEEEMLRWNLIKKGKIGRSNLILVEAEDVVGRQTSMVAAGNLPYDLPKNPIPTSAESL